MTDKKQLGKYSDLTEIYDEFIAAMDDDFNTTLAMSVVLKLTKLINKALTTKVEKDYLAGLNYLVETVCENVLGYKFAQSNDVAIESIIPEEIKSLAEQRIQAKADKDWTKADALRESIKSKGYNITDTKDGYKIEKISY